MRVVVFFVGLLLVPFAAADEGASACEEDQPWVGYRGTSAARAAFEAATAGSGASAQACEGEQWDGQDAVRRDEAASCSPSVRPQDGAPSAAWCLGSDPNGAPGADVVQPWGARASGRDEGGAREAYAATNVALVGRVAVYAGACAGGAGLEGEDACGGSREARAGVYARDNTPGNVLFTLVGCSLNRVCLVSEGDCDQATYQRGAMTGQSTCGRDNTALGAGAVLA